MGKDDDEVTVVVKSFVLERVAGTCDRLNGGFAPGTLLFQGARARVLWTKGR